MTGFAQDDTGVDVELYDGRKLWAQYLVGCDDGRNVIRKKAGIDFPGWDPSGCFPLPDDGSVLYNRVASRSSNTRFALVSMISN